MRNVSLAELKAVNAGVKFFIRDTADPQVGEHAEKWLAYLGQK